MSFSVHRPSRRLCAAFAAFTVLAACDEPLDFDMRGKLGAFSTSNAARAATVNRPAPDGRGIIAYPNYQVAVARRGDTVSQIADRIGMSATELARYNGLEPGMAMREGEVLALPRRVAEPSPATGATDIATLAGQAIDAAPDTSPSVQTTTLEPATARAPVRKPVATGPEPVRHKVARGETAYTISRLYQVPVKSLAEWNGLGSDFAIREGQYLLIPVKGESAPRRDTQVAAARTEVSEPGKGSDTPTPPSATKPLPDEVIDPDPETPDVSVGEPTRQAETAMGFPVQGKIVRAYKKGRNDGIDIAAAPGSSVAAAADGSVAAITADANKIPIVVVRHPDNLLTVYANVDQITVKKGDTVKRGQQIAQLRDGDKAYVHFEVRDGFDSVNPIPYLE